VELAGYYTLRLPIIDAAKSPNLAWKFGKDTGGRVNVSQAHFSSEWIMIARRPEYLQHLTEIETFEQRLHWTNPASTGKHLCRDGRLHDLKPLTRPQ
jgi:hypothetical protein